MIRESIPLLPPAHRSCLLIRGVGGGVVSQDYFKTHFGIIDSSGHADTKKANDVSSNVVSVLQAGAFFGALGSAPLSGARPSAIWVCFIPRSRYAPSASRVVPRAQHSHMAFMVPCQHLSWQMAVGLRYLITTC